MLSTGRAACEVDQVGNGIAEIFFIPSGQVGSVYRNTPVAHRLRNQMHYFSVTLGGDIRQLFLLEKRINAFKNAVSRFYDQSSNWVDYS